MPNFFGASPEIVDESTDARGQPGTAGPVCRGGGRLRECLVRVAERELTGQPGELGGEHERFGYHLMENRWGYGSEPAA